MKLFVCVCVEFAFSFFLYVFFYYLFRFFVFSLKNSTKFVGRIGRNCWNLSWVPEILDSSVVTKFCVPSSLQVDRAVELLENFNPSERADAINFLLIAVKNKFPETNEILRSVVAAEQQQLNNHNNNNNSISNTSSKTVTTVRNQNSNQCQQQNQNQQQQNFRKILCNENLVLVDSEDDEVEDLHDHGDSDGSANSPVSLVNQQHLLRRKALKRTFLTSTPSSGTSNYKRHFHEGRLLDRLILGEFFFGFWFVCTF